MRMQAGRSDVGQTYRQTNRQSQTDKGRQTHTHIDSHRQTGRQSYTQAGRKTDRETVLQDERPGDRQDNRHGSRQNYLNKRNKKRHQLEDRLTFYVFSPLHKKNLLLHLFQLLSPPPSHYPVDPFGFKCKSE